MTTHCMQAWSTAQTCETDLLFPIYNRTTSCLLRPTSIIVPHPRGWQLLFRRTVGRPYRGAAVSRAVGKCSQRAQIAAGKRQTAPSSTRTALQSLTPTVTRSSTLKNFSPFSRSASAMSIPRVTFARGLTRRIPTVMVPSLPTSSFASASARRRCGGAPTQSRAFLRSLIATSQVSSTVTSSARWPLRWDSAPVPTRGSNPVLREPPPLPTSIRPLAGFCPDCPMAAHTTVRDWRPRSPSERTFSTVSARRVRIRVASRA